MFDTNALTSPRFDVDLLSEYDETLQIMVNTFPWLFPGGIGDVWDRERGSIDIKEWGQHLLKYHDGRFIRDQLFVLYLFNSISRKKNNSQGTYFFKSEHFFTRDPPTLEELKYQISKGDDRFVQMLQYYAHNIRGSDSYWRSKAHELEYWVNYHLAAGHGPPTFFITLSCAENWWPDLRQLMIDLTTNAGDTTQAALLASGDFRAMCKAVVAYPVYVNEFFMKRSKELINTVLKDALGIKYHWGRIEFAPGRGTIHLHLLCIPEDHAYLKEYHKANTNNEKATVAGTYMESRFDYTADVKIDHTKEINRITSPLSCRYCEVKDIKEDARALAEDCMCHICNKYCLQDGKKNNPRVCRHGFGTESEHGNENTEGKPLISEHQLRVDRSGITHLEMKRTQSKRLQQHSRTLLQTWRANIDVKCILFDTDPLHPDIREIDELIKYVCAYTVKKHKTIKQEKEIIQNLIQW